MKHQDANHDPGYGKPMNDSDLDELLKCAGSVPTAPAGFQRDVWQRIAAEETKGWKFRLQQGIERALACLAVPRMAVATCTAVVIAGSWIGSISASPDPAHEVSYLHSISPFAHTTHR